MTKEQILNSVRSRLLNKPVIEPSGIYQIIGEDLNCDLGGNHHSPVLEIVEGNYGDVVEYALTLPGFIAWGYGGDVVKTEMLSIKKVSNANIIRDEISYLEKQLMNLTQESTNIQNRIDQLRNNYSKTINHDS